MAQAPQLRPRLFRLLFLVISALLVVWATACEKDDICVDGDTPQLVITFFDYTQPGNSRTVNKLRVIGLGKGTPVNTFGDRSNQDSIGLPLRADQTRTGFVFIVDSADDADGNETGNRDTLYFDYETRSVYISRACGFVPNFDGLSASPLPDASIWIDSVEIRQTTIENARNAHVSIYY